MKKTLALILAVSMLLLYVGCAPQTEQPNPAPDTGVTEQDNETKNDNHAEADDKTDPNTTTADENTEESTPDKAEAADDGEDTLELTGTVTVTSMEELKKLYEAGCFGYNDHFYDYFYRFFVEGWEFPEVNDVVFSNISFTFRIPLNNCVGVDYSFTVEESNLEGLKPGNYRRHIEDGVYDFYITDPDHPYENRFSDVEEVRKLNTFICFTGFWNTPFYGKGKSYPGAYDFIRVNYGDQSDYFKLDYESICKYAKEEFGVTEPEKMYIVGGMSKDGYFWPIYERYRAPEYDITDVQKSSNGTEITVQTYSDIEHFVYSHKILYYFDAEGHFNGYKVIEKGKYEPRGLIYIEDDGTLEAHGSDNLKYYMDLGLFSKKQYDFYCDLLNSEGEFQTVISIVHSICFKPMEKEDSFESYIDFEVIKSRLDTLPVGEYHRKLVSGGVMSFEDVDPSEAAKVIVGKTQTH